MKKAFALIAAAVLVGAGCASATPAPTQAPATGTHVSRAGEIVSVDLDQVAADGPAVVVFRDAEGQTRRIHVPSFGLPLCEARENIADVYALKAGDAIEVRGAAQEDGAIVPCESPEDYLRLAK